MIDILPIERYSCCNCSIDFSYQNIYKSWKCPHCEGYLHIYAEDLETKTKVVLIRKQAKEVTPGDLVHLPYHLRKESHVVLGVNQLKSHLGIGLKGYGQFKVKPDQFVHIRIGGLW